MEEEYKKLILFIEDLYQHKFVHFNTVNKLNTKMLQKNAFCNMCGNTFTLDITYENFNMIKNWNLLSKFYFRFLRHNGNHDEKLTCNDLIIKNIIE